MSFRVRRSNSVNMLEGNLLPKILLFALPLALSSLLQLFFNADDLVVVGKYAGDNCQAAVSSTSSLINLITNLFIGLSVGCNVTVAKCLGARDRQQTKDAVYTSISLAIIAGIVLTIVGIFLSRTLLELMSSPENVIDLSTTYLRIYFFGMLGMMTYNFGAAILRAKGDTNRPLFILLISGVTNALLNLFFVVVMGMDVDGVALATVISQYLSAGLILWCLGNEEGALRVDLKHLYISVPQMKNIAKVGLPAGIQGTVFSISNVTIQSSINSFGSTVMAGNGAASSIEGFVYSGMNAFYQASMTFTSQNLGAKKYDRLNKILLVSIACVTVTGILLGGGAYLFGNTLLGIYSDNPEVIAYGMVRLNYVGKVYFLCGVMDVIVGSLRGLGESILPMIVSLLGACASRLLWIATIFAANRTLEVLYLSYPISWIITAVAQMIIYIIVRNRIKREYELAD